MTEYRVKLNGKTIGFVIFQERFSDKEATRKLIEEDNYDKNVKASYERSI